MKNENDKYNFFSILYMDKIITTTIETLIKIPYKHIFSWKQYIIKDWH